MTIINGKPETYFSSEPVKINDDKGNFFYYHINKRKGMFFNLPEGVYYSDNFLVKQNKKDYRLLNLPAPEHFFDHKNIKLITNKKNPCRASITPLDKEIKLDKDLAKISFYPALVFVLAHEFGHLRYKTENYCDMFSVNFMLQKGYNPVQILMCCLGLFKNNPERKKYIQKLFSQQNFIL